MAMKSQMGCYQITFHLKCFMQPSKRALGELRRKTTRGTGQVGHRVQHHRLVECRTGLCVRRLQFYA